MISDTARYHGSFFSVLFEAFDVPLTIEKLTDYGSGYFLVERRYPLYLKYSSNRRGPWSFNFYRSHQESLEKLFKIHGECFVCLICGKDGFVGLNMGDLRQVLDGNFEDQECISVRRRLNTMYHIKGRNGNLESKVSRRSIFEKLKKVID